MKERDITELLVCFDDRPNHRTYRPFVILPRRMLEAEEEGAESFAGYPVWLEVCHSIEEARIKAQTRRQAISESPDQTVEGYTELPSVEWPVNGQRVMIYVAHSELAERRSELLIGRISDNLYLWGVNNPP